MIPKSIRNFDMNFTNFSNLNQHSKKINIFDSNNNSNLVNKNSTENFDNNLFNFSKENTFSKFSSVKIKENSFEKIKIPSFVKNSKSPINLKVSRKNILKINPIQNNFKFEKQKIEQIKKIPKTNNVTFSQKLAFIKNFQNSEEENFDLKKYKKEIIISPEKKKKK